MIIGDVAAFVDESRVAFADACAQLGRVDRRYRLGPTVLRLNTAGQSFADSLDTTFAHLRVADDAEPGLTISVWDRATSGVAMPRAPWTPEAYQGKNEIELSVTDRYAASYEIGAHSLSLFDRDQRSAMFWTRDATALPSWEFSSPFRSIFHWYFGDTSLQPIHAGAVGTEDGGILIGGRSGIGKTTTTISCVRGGLRYASDDYILADTAAAHAYSLFNSARFTDDSLVRFPEFAASVVNPTRGPDDKALVYGHHAFGDQVVAGLPIRGIAVPRVTGLSATTIAAISPAVAVRALAPTTIAHLPGGGPSTLAKITQLCRSVPCIELAVGTDLAALPVAISDWLASNG